MPSRRMPRSLLMQLLGAIFIIQYTGTFTQVYFPNQNANPDLQWEKRIGRNIGLDFALLNNRLTGDFNVFNDRTENLLFDYTLPSPPFIILPPAGGRPESATVLANVGTLSNKGVEFSLNYQDYR
jgi:outer membrane receptor protein involved in Fe transport